VISWSQRSLPTQYTTNTKDEHPCLSAGFDPAVIVMSALELSLGLRNYRSRQQCRIHHKILESVSFADRSLCDGLIPCPEKSYAKNVRQLVCSGATATLYTYTE
jgi:hypothetical protein